MIKWRGKKKARGNSKKPGKVKKPGLIKVSSFVENEESCAFCDRPHSGHLITEFKKEASDLAKGLAISVCDHCQKHRSDKIRTVFEKV